VRGELFCSISEPCPKCVKAFAWAMKLSRESGALPCIHVDPVTITCKLPIKDSASGCEFNV
jgi:predicted transporter